MCRRKEGRGGVRETERVTDRKSEQEEERERERGRDYLVKSLHNVCEVDPGFTAWQYLVEEVITK